MANWDYKNIQEQSNLLLNWFDIIVAAKNPVAESISYSSEGMAHKTRLLRWNCETSQSSMPS